MAGAAWQLRPDVELIPAESEGVGPAFLVHDPVTGTFDRVEWPASDLLWLLREPRSLESLATALAGMSTLKPTVRDVADYVAELGRRGWLKGRAFWPDAYRERRRGGALALFARLLFVQIPLARPERFLKATAGTAGLLVSPAVLGLLALCGIAGLYLMLPRWDEYWLASLGGFSLGRAPSFAAALILVKLAHELAHAYAATRAGARVPTMGVAFFFLMPLPFTDVTDAWRLSWPRRTRVAVAGMLAETAVAGVTLLLWSLSPPGEAAAVCARLSSVAVLSTVLTNINPGPRFDGYYLLVCLFRMENLRSRSTALLRGFAWRTLFGVNVPDSEPGTRAMRRLAMLVYAGYAVAYRVGLGFGLALMVYVMLPKVFALPLAAVLLFLFFGMPVMGEVGLVWNNRKRIRPTPALVALVLILAAATVWAAGSWPRRVAFPAVTRAGEEEAVRSRRSGVVTEIRVGRDGDVAAGGTVAVLDAPADPFLLRRLEWAVREAELAEEQSWRTETSRRESARRAAETRRRRSELDALRQRLKLLAVTAPVAGTVRGWDDQIRVGLPVGKDRLFGWVTAGPTTLLSCYADMETAARLDPEGTVRFFPDDGGGFMTGRIVRIDRSRPEMLEDPALGAALGAMRTRSGRLALPSPYAKVVVVLDEDAGRVGQTGRVWAWTEPESLISRAVGWLGGLAVRESSF